MNNKFFITNKSIKIKQKNLYIQHIKVPLTHQTGTKLIIQYIKIYSLTECCVVTILLLI